MTQLQVAMVLLIAAGISYATAQTHAAQAALEQSHFSAEDEGVQSPVPIPDNAWAILKSAKEARIYLDGGDTPTPPQRDWFSAAVVHLQSLEKSDLVVEAKGPLRGANVNTFWIFLNTSEGMKLVLTAPVHDLLILRSRWNGVRTIELDSMTCCKITTVWLRYEHDKFNVHRQIAKDIQ